MSYYQKIFLSVPTKKMKAKQCCAVTGGEDYFKYLKTQLVTLGIHGPDKIRLSQSGCLGRCAVGPCLVIYPEGTWYTYSSFADLDAIVENHLIAGKIVEKCLLPM